MNTAKQSLDAQNNGGSPDVPQSHAHDASDRFQLSINDVLHQDNHDSNNIMGHWRKHARYQNATQKIQTPPG